jgi:V/A-type H+-transporting ATPase subunit E
MTNRVLELTEKIYKEGIEKANEEARQIIAKAREESEKIIAAAKNNAREITEQAQKEAREYKQSTDAEMELATRQFISKLKQEIARNLIVKQVKSPVKHAFEDDKFLKKIILTIVKNWSPQQKKIDLNLLLPEKDEKKLEGFFKSKAKELLDKGLEVKFNANIKSGFKVGPKDGQYYISFTDQDFENCFKDYLKDKTKKMIFNS